VIAPSIQIFIQPPEAALVPYTQTQLRGRNQYVKNGCLYCHSQQPRDPNFGSDQQRNWGRASTPGDYAYDYPHLLGTMRTGPDLLNIGVRQPSVDWHLLNLFQPRAVLPNSVMPSFAFLFEIKKTPATGDKVVMVPPQFAPKEGLVIAKPEALELVAYLLSLNRNYAPTQRLLPERKTHE
jgi:cytochrome c oxidase cbb3-type subunit 2